MKSYDDLREKGFPPSECDYIAELINESYLQGRADERIKVLEEVKSKMISFHTDAIFQYGTDIIEAGADAFNELKDWLKEECNDNNN